MGAPVWIDYNCNHCNLPNKIAYATMPRINEHLISQVNEIWHDNGTVTRVWRCICAECGRSNIFNDGPDGFIHPTYEDDSAFWCNDCNQKWLDCKCREEVTNVT